MRWRRAWRAVCSAFAEDPVHAGEMQVVKPGFAELVHGRLEHHAGRQFRRLAQGRQTLDAGAPGHHPAHPDAREQDLGEGAAVDHLALGVHGLDGRREFAEVLHLLFEAVLQDRHPAAAAQGQEGLPVGLGAAPAGGILERGHGVDQGRRLPVHQGGQGGQVHPLRAQGDPHRLQAVEPHQGQGLFIGGRFHRHLPPRLRQHPEDQVQALLGTMGDQDLLGGGGDPVDAQAPGQVLAQGWIALAVAVAQEGLPLPAQHLVHAGPERFHGQQARIQAQRAEVDDSRFPGRPRRRRPFRHQALAGAGGLALPGEGLGRDPAGLDGGHQPRPHLRAGSGAQVDPALGPQFLVHHRHGGPVHAQLGRQAPGRGQAFPHAQGAALQVAADLLQDLQRPGLLAGRFQPQQHACLPGNSSTIRLTGRPGTASRAEKPPVQSCPARWAYTRMEWGRRAAPGLGSS